MAHPSSKRPATGRSSSSRRGASRTFRRNDFRPVPDGRSFASMRRWWTRASCRSSACPKAGSLGTSGRVTAEVVRPLISSAADAARYRGTLKGKIVLTQPARAVRMLEHGDGTVLRYDDDGGKWRKEAMTGGPPRPPVPPATPDRRAAAPAASRSHRLRSGSVLPSGRRRRAVRSRRVDRPGEWRQPDVVAYAAHRWRHGRGRRTSRCPETRPWGCPRSRSPSSTTTAWRD